MRPTVKVRKALKRNVREVLRKALEKLEPTPTPKPRQPRAPQSPSPAPPRRHFVKDYTRHVEQVLADAPSEQAAMSAAIGGNFESIGQIESDLLWQYGLRDGSRLIDLGCGSGRTAVAVARDLNIEYHGIDIVPKLLAHAKAHTPSHYRYSLVDGLSIPDASASADMVCAFSLFTHLLHEETFTYLQEVVRVLKPGGVLVFSFLEFRVPAHWGVFVNKLAHVQTGKSPHLDMFFERNAIEVWAGHLGLEVVDWMDSTQGDRIPLTRPVTLDSGQAFKDRATLGQSVCVLRKP